jgi:hypothetical protein
MLHEIDSVKHSAAQQVVERPHLGAPRPAAPIQQRPRNVGSDIWPCLVPIWQRHRVTTSIDSGSLTRTFPTHNPTQRFTTRFGGCRSTLSTGGPTRVRFYLYLRPRLKVSVSSPPCYETLRQTS